MQTKVKDLWEKVKGFFNKLNKKVRILLGVGAAVLLILILAAVLLLNRKEYALLYGGLTANETSTIVKYLSDNGLSDYQIRGDAIYVPKGRETQLQAQLALSGYNTSGFMYEYYRDNISAISTTDEQDRAWLVAGQQYLAAVIRGIDGVRDAQVGITPGTDQVYVLDPNATPAKAFVQLDLDGNQPLSSQKIEAIRNIVAHGVERLEIDNVSITDNLGSTYTDTNGIGEMSQASALKFQYEEEINNKVRTSILDSLIRVYGEENVSVTVNSSVDISRKVVESTQYEQPEGSVEGGGLIGSDKLFWEVIRDGSEPVGGPVGTETNSDISTYPNLEDALNGDKDYVGEQLDREHNLNTTTEQREVLAGTITDIGVAVTINQNAPNAGAQNVDALREHIAVMANIGSEDPASRVSVMIVPFNNDTVQPGGPITLLPGVDNWIVLAAVGGLLLFIVLLVIILLLRSGRKKKKLAQQRALEEEMMEAQAAEAAAIAAAAAAVAPTGGADIMEVNTEKSMELRKTVRQFAQNNPEIAAQMVKAWLKGEESNA